MTIEINVGTELQLQQAIATVDGSAPGDRYFIIKFTANITEGTDAGDTVIYNGSTISTPDSLFAFNIASGRQVTIDGNGFALDGANTYRGLFDYAGILAVRNLTIQNMVAQGGNGTNGGGGGAGLGGGLLVGGSTAGDPGQVDLNDVTFSNDTASGGAGSAGSQGAGGDIFVQQGGTLFVGGGSLGLGDVTGGAGANPGSPFGSAMFLQGNQTIGLAAEPGQTLVIAGAIADQSGSGGTGANSGSAGVVIVGYGTVELQALNSYTAGTTIYSGTLLIDSGASAGSGPITFAGVGTLELGVGDTVASISGFDISSDQLLFLNTSAASLTLSQTAAGAATVDGIAVTGTFLGLQLLDDGSGNAELVSAPLQVSDIAGLNAAIAAADAITAAGTLTIDLNGDIALNNTALNALNLAQGVSLYIEGNGHTLDGGDNEQGLFVYAALYPNEVSKPALYCAPRLTRGFHLADIRDAINQRAGLSPARKQAAALAIKRQRRTARTKTRRPASPA